MLVGKPRKDPALLVTTFEGYGDLIYHTPTLRILSKIYPNLDVWCKRPEPFLHNPHIKNLSIFDKTWPHSTEKYGNRIFHVSVDSLVTFPHCNIHTVDLVSIKALRCVLRDEEKTLEAYWTAQDLERVEMLLAKHQINKKKFIAISPSITWASRTLPLAFYQKIIEGVQKEGWQVVLVGKEIFYSSGVDTDKTLYPESYFPGAICLYNQLSFAELCCLYSLTPIAINTENGNHPISCTNDFCWNLYIPTLTAPEYRLPYRRGSQGYRTILATNEENYYPASVYGDTGTSSYTNMPIRLPTIERVLSAFRAIEQKEIS